MIVDDIGVVMKCKHYLFISNMKNNKGSVLITIIIAIVAVSTLGAGIAYIGRTTPFLQTSQHLESMAFNLAESGFRHVYPALYNSSQANRPAIVANINNTSYTFANEGKFTITASWDAGTKTATVVSTGIVNENSNIIEGRYVVTYVVNWPGESEDTMPNKDNWQASLGPQPDIKNESHDNALVIKSDSAGAEGLVTWKWVPDKVPAPTSDGLLNYEMQVKINADTSGNKGKEYMLGLSFRISQVSTGRYDEYGVSFLRNEDAGDNKHALPPVFGAFFYPPAKPLGIYVVLWKKINNVFTIIDYHLATVPDGIVTALEPTQLADGGTTWCVLIAKVEERFDLSGNRENVISIYVKDPTARGTISWEYSTFKPINWTYNPPAWSSQTDYPLGATVRPTTWNGYYYVCTLEGTSGSSEPTWPTTNGETVSDGSGTWTATQWTQGSSIVDGSLTSLDMESDLSNPLEVGMHVFYDSPANQEAMFDDFAIRRFGGAGTVVQQ
jgi:hypothetical protein